MKQTATDAYVEELAAKDARLKIEISHLTTSIPDALAPNDIVQALSRDVAALKASSDDGNNKLRGNNLIFLAFQTLALKNERSTRKKVINFCSELLNITLETNHFSEPNALAG